jgi:hypothetical protein
MTDDDRKIAVCFAIVASIAAVLAAGCGGHAPKGRHAATATATRAADVTAGPGRLVDVGGGRRLYLRL